MKIYTAVLIAVIGLLSVEAPASTPGSQVVTKTKVTTKKVAHKTKRGTKHLYAKTATKTRPIRKKTWHGGKKVVHKTKKILS
jgi:hypothetical protein